MYIKFVSTILIVVFILNGCANYNTGWDGPGLKSGTISEEDVKADKWDRKDLVASIQSSLNELGYPIDNQEGIEDESTKSAVVKYKSDHGLEVNNIVDANLEKHIDDSVWAQRKSRSPDPKELAKKYADEQEKKNCEIVLGEEYKEIAVAEPKSGNTVIYVYRYTPNDNEFNIYPNTNIFINDQNKGLISDNGFMRYEISTGQIKIYESSDVQFDIEKRAEPFTFIAKKNEIYFIRLLAGKYDGAKTYTNIRGTSESYWPYWMVGGVVGYLLHQAVDSALYDRKATDKTTNEKFYFADFIKTSNEIGKCHIQAIYKFSKQ